MDSILEKAIFLAQPVGLPVIVVTLTPLGRITPSRSLTNKPTGPGLP
jgi:hypothetical protein